MRRWIVALVVVALASVPTAPAGGFAGFGDIALGRFFTKAVQWMVDNKYTTGTSPTCFSPDDPVTRGQAAAFLHRIAGEPVPGTVHPFTDVVAPWQLDPVSWMFEKGITTGKTPTTYGPDDPLTRGQMSALIWRNAGEPVPGSVHPFTDVVAPWQLDPVSWMFEKGITTGTSETEFSPDDPVTRGQFATFAYRWMGEPPVVIDAFTPLCSTSDDFDGGLELGWDWVSGDPSMRSFTSMPGYLSVTGPHGGSGIGPQVLVRDPVADNFTIETKVGFAPVADFQAAGLTIRQDADNEVTISRGFCGTTLCVGDGIYFDNIAAGMTAFDFEAVAVPAGTGDVWLRLQKTNGTFNGSYSLDGINWTTLASRSRTMSDLRYGIFTGRSVNGTVPTADFDYFSERDI